MPVTFFTNLVTTYGTRFDKSFLNTLVLTIIRATDAGSFIHGSLVNPRGLFEELRKMDRNPAKVIL